MARTHPHRAPPQLGVHASIGGGLATALERGAALGCEVIQLFTRPNRQWRARPLSKVALCRWHKARTTRGVVPSLAHDCYLINLAAASAPVRRRSFATWADEYRRCGQLRIPNLVFHPGAHVGQGEAAGIRRIVVAINRLLDEQPENPTRLLLENTAGQGSALGYRFEHLRDILAGLKQPDRVGVCLDTCHAFAAGYDLRTTTAWNRTFGSFDQRVGVARIHAFHVNDSKSPLGSRVDRHHHLGRGHLGLRAFSLLVNDPRFRGLPMVLETPKPNDRADQTNLAVLRTLSQARNVTRRARQLASGPELD